MVLLVGRPIGSGQRFSNGRRDSVARRSGDVDLKSLCSSGHLVVESDGSLLPSERSVFEAVGLVGLGTELLVPDDLVVGEVALEPAHLRVALEGQHVCTDAVEKPPVVADDHGAPGKCEEGFFKGAQGVDVEVVRRFVEEQQVAA